MRILNPKLGIWTTRAVGYLLVVFTTMLILSLVRELISGDTTLTNKWARDGVRAGRRTSQILGVSDVTLCDCSSARQFSRTSSMTGPAGILV